MSEGQSAGVETVLVTGGATSVGRAIVDGFLARGAKVVLNDLRMIDVPADALAVEGDISDPAIQAALFVGLDGRPRGYDFVVNTVGIPGPRAPMEFVPLADWRHVFEVNVTAALAVMQLAVPFMKDRGFGGIVNFSSSSTLTGLPNRLPYVASKFALEGLTRTAARELGPFGIRCNCILPGFIDNERGRKVVVDAGREVGLSPDDAIAESLRFISLRKMVTVEELAQMVLYLCSPAGRTITGQMIAVDGNSEWDS
jgi:NAD(P)-dependent dehydrogenase (short-subunit alcohol dehydrogenase family)